MEWCSISFMGSQNENFIIRYTKYIDILIDQLPKTQYIIN